MKIITPVVVIAYNRPLKTLRLLNSLKKIKLSKIIFICDGPKQNNNLDKNKCKKVNNLIKKIKFNCKKEYIISKKNLGLKNRIYSGLNQVFKKYDRAIILEDDCIPNFSFFYFCEKVLKIYSKNKKIAGISGNNFLNQNINNSFYFSKYSSIWGWATWSRVWKKIDINIKFWPKYKNSLMWINSCPDIVERHFWNNLFDNVYKNKINSWAYSYLLNNFYHKRLTVVPRYNLVKNIGFGKGSTNTKHYNKFFFPPVKKIEKKLSIPSKIIQNKKGDIIDFARVYGGGRRNSYPIKFFFMLYVFFLNLFTK